MGGWRGEGGRGEGVEGRRKGGEPVHEKHGLMPPSYPVNYKYVGRSTTRDRLQSAGTQLHPKHRCSIRQWRASFADTSGTG